MVPPLETNAVGRGCAHHRPSNDDAAALAAVEQTLRVVQRLLVTLEPVADHPGQTARSTLCVPDSGLSRREVEVLRLLAAGLSTRQIAAALSLSPRTVQRHVANVYPKFGAHCWARATTYAPHHSLA